MFKKFLESTDKQVELLGGTPNYGIYWIFKVDDNKIETNSKIDGYVATLGEWYIQFGDMR